MVQQGQQRTEVPKSQRLEAMATSYPLTRQSGVLPSSNLFSSDIKWLRNTAMVWTVWDKCSSTCIYILCIIYILYIYTCIIRGYSEYITNTMIHGWVLTGGLSSHKLDDTGGYQSYWSDCCSLNPHFTTKDLQLCQCDINFCWLYIYNYGHNYIYIY